MNLKLYFNSYSKVEWLIFGVISSLVSWWPIWSHSFGAPLCYLFLVLLCYYLNKQNRFHPSNTGVSILLIFYFFVLQIFNQIHITSLIIPFAFMASTCLTAKESVRVVDLVTSYISISILISLPLWLIHQYLYEFQPFQVMDISSWKGNDGDFYLNYVFFVTYDGIEANRFYSLFDEPGVLGTISAFILWANGYNFKDKRCLLILIGALFTYSMAFYSLTVFGWLAKSKFKVSSVIKTMILLVLIGGCALYILKDNLAFQQSILYRFSNLDESGVASRTTEEFNKRWDSFVRTSDLVFGLGSGSTSKFAGKTSYRVFVMEYGVIGLLILLFAYFRNIKIKNYYTLMTLFIFVLSFLQRPDLFNPENILLFTCIVRTTELNTINKYATSRFL